MTAASTATTSAATAVAATGNAAAAATRGFGSMPLDPGCHIFQSLLTGEDAAALSAVNQNWRRIATVYWRLEEGLSTKDNGALQPTRWQKVCLELHQQKKKLSVNPTCVETQREIARLECDKRELEYTRFVMDLFGGRRAFENLPVLEMGKKARSEQRKGKDFDLSITQITAPVMRGFDGRGRLFFTVVAKENGRIVGDSFLLFPYWSYWMAQEFKGKVGSEFMSRCIEFSINPLKGRWGFQYPVSMPSMSIYGIGQQHMPIYKAFAELFRTGKTTLLRERVGEMQEYSWALITPKECKEIKEKQLAKRYAFLWICNMYDKSGKCEEYARKKWFRGMVSRLSKDPRNL